jgi:hypothetical protein
MDDLSDVLSLGDAQNPPPERMLQILTAAARLFATQGYDGTSMRDIAQECGDLQGDALPLLPGQGFHHPADGDGHDQVHLHARRRHG